MYLTCRCSCLTRRSGLVSEISIASGTAEHALLSSCDLVIGFIPWIDHFAHIGGLVGGFLTGLVVLVIPRHPATHPRHESYPVYTMVLACISLLILLPMIATLSMYIATSQDGNEACSVCGYLTCIPVSPYWCCTYPNRYFNC